MRIKIVGGKRHFHAAEPDSASERLMGALALALYCPEGTDLITAYGSIKHGAANYLRDCARGIHTPSDNAFQRTLNAMFPASVKQTRLYLCARFHDQPDYAVTLHRINAVSSPEPLSGQSTVSLVPTEPTMLWAFKYPRVTKMDSAPKRDGIKVDWPLSDLYPADVLAGTTPRLTRVIMGPKTFATLGAVINEDLRLRHYLTMCVLTAQALDAIHDDTISLYYTASAGKVVLRYSDITPPLSSASDEAHERSSLGHYVLPYRFEHLRINTNSKPGPKKRCHTFCDVSADLLDDAQGRLSNHFAVRVKGAQFYESEPDVRNDILFTLRELLLPGIVPFCGFVTKEGPVDFFGLHYLGDSIDISRYAKGRSAAAFDLMPAIKRQGRSSASRKIIWTPNRVLNRILHYHITEETFLAPKCHSFMLQNVLLEGETPETYFAEVLVQ